MALAKKCDRCGKLYEHYSGFNACMMVNVDDHGHIYSTETRNDLCPDCMKAITDFMNSTDNSKEHLTPELVTGIIGQFLDECTLNKRILDVHAVNLLEELYQTALAEVK